MAFFNTSWKVLTFVIVLLLITGSAFGQMHKKKKRKERDVICPFNYHDKLISHGLGARIGDPLGLTYKIYYKRRIALEFTGGIGFSGLYAPIHRDKFLLIEKYQDFEYIAHEVDHSYAHQGRIILHNNFPGYHRLDWYVGLGYHVRWYQLRYVFNFEDEDNRQDVGSDTFNDFDLGPELALGFEYDYPNVPLTVFAEGGAFYNAEGVKNFWRIQAGLGVRVDF